MLSGDKTQSILLMNNMSERKCVSHTSTLKYQAVIKQVEMQMSSLFILDHPTMTAHRDEGVVDSEFSAE